MSNSRLFAVFLCSGFAMMTLSACQQAEADTHGASQHAEHDHGHAMMLTEDGIEQPDNAVRPAGQTLPYFTSDDFTPLWLEPGSSKVARLHRIPQFAFVNQEGEDVTSEDYAGKIYVATFFFATCPGICSPINTRLLTVQSEILGMDDVRILSHSITPQIDTVDVLANYASEHEIDAATWDLVTGERADLYAVAKAGYFASDDLGEDEAEGDFKHTENLLLIDRNGNIRGIYNGLSRNAMQDLITDIGLLRAEQPARL